MNLGEMLVGLRKKKGKSRKEVANDLDIVYVSYSQYERGLREPDYKTLIKIANYYGVTLDYLLGRSSLQTQHAMEISSVPNEFNLTLDGIPLTEEELEYVIAFIRTKRIMPT